MIEIKNLSFYQEKKPILQDVSLNIETGKFTALIGPNGAGKTSLIKSILGAYPHQSGEIIIDEYNGMGYVPEWESFAPSTKVYEFLKNICELKKIAKENIDEVINAVLTDMDLHNHKKKPIGKLSSGMRKKVIFGMAFIGDPELVILDEPLANLDPTYKIQIVDFLDKQIKLKKTILISSHMLNDIEGLVDNVIFISNGKTIVTNPNADNSLVVVSKNVLAIKKWLDKNKIKFKMAGVNKIILKMKSLAKVNETISKLVKIKDNKILSLKINDIENQYHEKIIKANKEIIKDRISKVNEND